VAARAVHAMTWVQLPVLLLPPVDAQLALDIERIHRLEAAGTIDMETAEWMFDCAHGRFEAQLARLEEPPRRWECPRCGTVSSNPSCRPGCLNYETPR
jgi:hypothetical protein